MTVNDVLAAAMVLLRRFQEDALISGAGLEVVEAVRRTLNGIYQIGARVNPGYHGKVLAVAESAGTWTRPADAELVTLLQDSTGVEVFPSTPEEPIPDPARSFVVRWGQVYRRPTGVVVPAGALTFWYSRRPAAPTTLASEVDLEDTFASLLIYDVGAWLAHRDENWEGLAAIISDRDRYLSLYVASLEHESVGTVRNVGQTGTYDSPSLVDLKSLLFSPAG